MSDGGGWGWAGLRRRPCCQVEVEGGRDGGGGYDDGGRCLSMFMSRTSAHGYLRSERQRVGILEKRKVGEKKKKLTRQHSEMEPSKVNLSPDPQSEWLCLFMVTLPSFFPKSLNHPYHRDSTVKSSGSGFFKRYWRNPTNRATRNICMPARGRSSDSDVTDIDGRSPKGKKKKKTVTHRTMSFVMVC